MSKSLRTKLVFALSSLCAVLIALSFAFAMTVKADGTQVPAEPEGVNVVYSENFDSIPAGFDNLELTSNGALIKSGIFALPIAEADLPASNNYEVEFDLFLKTDAVARVVFKGLAVDKQTGNAGDISMRVEAGGTYWILDAGNNQQIYNNSGTDHGALDATPVPLTESAARVKLVHFEGYVELWVNGTRRIVTHLEGFGNNNYNTRGTFDEGKITAIEFSSDANNSMCLDNIKVTEAVGKSTSYTETNSATGAYGKTFSLSAQNLYHENYVIETTFNVFDSSKSDYFPTLRLFGINNSLKATYGGENAYFINVQSHVSGNVFNAGIYYHTPEHLNGDWAGIAGSKTVESDADGNMVYRLEVYGDNLDFCLNGEKVISTTFTEMGFPKGSLQYIVVRDTNANTGSAWTSFSYYGYEGQTAAVIKADKDRVMAGETLTVTADVYGNKEGEEFFWYIDGVKQSEEGLTLTVTDLSEGEHVIVYKSENVESNEIKVSCSDRRITISLEDKDKTFYPIDEIKVNAGLEGDFTGETVVWYLNGEALEEAGETLTLSGLAAGDYTLVYKTDGVTSNVISFTVNEGFVTVTTEKGSYFNSENATFTAELTGISEDAAIKWFVDGVEVAGETGKTFTLSLSDVTIGSQILVKCTANGSESEEVPVSVVYDVYDKITNDENYKVLPQVAIEEGGGYGDYLVGSDDEGNYLYSGKQAGEGGPYWQYSGEMPTGIAFIFSYKLYIPADINGIYYVYPCLQGMNSKYPNMAMETAVEVNAKGLRPYIKDQGTNKSYDADSYGFGKDLTYGAGIVDKGEWFDICVAVDGMYISMYINGEIVLFFRLATATVSSSVSFNMWPDAGDTIPVRMKDIKFACIEEPLPDLTAVTITVSETEIEAGGSVTFTARPNPFNAETNNIVWYVNGKAVEGNGLTYVFTSDKGGEYKVYCTIDGITSNERTITVTAAPGGGNPALLWSLVGVGIGLVVIGGGVAVFFIIRKKKAAGKTIEPDGDVEPKE